MPDCIIIFQAIVCQNTFVGFKAVFRGYQEATQEQKRIMTREFTKHPTTPQRRYTVQITHQTARTELKESNQLSLPLQNDCETGFEVIKLEYSLGLKIKRNDWQPIIALYFESENELKFYSFKAWLYFTEQGPNTKLSRKWEYCL